MMSGTSFALGAHRGPLFVVLLGSLYSGQVFCADGGLDRKDAGTDLYFGELPVVLSASRLAQPIFDAPASVSVIDREMIETSGAREIADVFRLVPGMVVAHVDGHRRAVGYLGMLDAFNRRMQVLIDGRSVYTSFFGGVRWNELSITLDDIERIEVVRGPNAATFGPNSFAGIISITTRHPTLEHGDHVRVAGGQNGYREAVYRFTREDGDFAYRVTAKASEDNGFPSLGVNQGDRSESALLNFRGDKQLTAKDALEFQAGFNDGPRRVGEGTSVNPAHNQHVANYFLQGRWRHTASEDEESSLQIYFNSYDLDEKYPASDVVLGIPVSAEIDYGRESRRLDIEFQHSQASGDDLRWVWGAEVRRDESVSPVLLVSPRIKNNLYRTFANLEWQVTPRTLVNIGAMVEKNDLTGTDTSPRIAVNHRIDSNSALRFSASAATRTPSLYEAKAESDFLVTSLAPPPYDQMYALDLLSTEKLKPESVHSLELAYLFATTSSQLHGEFRVFRDKLDRLIDTFDVPMSTYKGLLVLGGETSSFNNSAALNIQGAELQLNWRPTPKDRLVLGYAMLNTTSEKGDPDLADTVPDHTMSLLYLHRWSAGITTSLNYYHLDDIHFVGDGDPVPGYDRLDLRLAKKTRIKGQPAEFALVVQNVGDEYSEFIEDNIFGTRVYVSASFSL